MLIVLDIAFASLFLENSFLRNEWAGARRAGPIDGMIDKQPTWAGPTRLYKAHSLKPCLEFGYKVMQSWVGVAGHFCPGQKQKAGVDTV